MPDSDLKQTFDYNARAEVFTQRGRMAKRSPVTYKRFATAAEAIRYAIEEMPAEMLASAVLEVDEDRYGAAEIKSLYGCSGLSAYARRAQRCCAAEIEPRSGGRRPSIHARDRH